MKWGEHRSLPKPRRLPGSTRSKQQLNAASIGRPTKALLNVAQPLAGSRNLTSERDEATAQAREALRNEHRGLKDELLAVIDYAPPGETSLDPLYREFCFDRC